MSQSESKQPIFEEYPVVDCEDCQSYWKDECDGTPVGSEKVCKAFKATRRRDIPLKTEWLLRGYKRLTIGLLMGCAAEMCLAIAFLLLYWRLT